MSKVKSLILASNERSHACGPHRDSKVLEYYNKALEVYKANNYVIGETITTGNIGSVLINLKR